MEHPAPRVGQHHLDVGSRENIGRLGHEMHAAEDDEFRIALLGRPSGQFETVTREVGKVDYIILLIMMARG